MTIIEFRPSVLNPFGTDHNIIPNRGDGVYIHYEEIPSCNLTLYYVMLINNNKNITFKLLLKNENSLENIKFIEISNGCDHTKKYSKITLDPQIIKDFLETYYRNISNVGIKSQLKTVITFLNYYTD